MGTETIITTERLALRELTLDDLDALRAALDNESTRVHYPYTFDEARVRWWIERSLERYRTFGFGLWAVTLRETGELIGDCGLTMQNIHGVIRPEVGYHIHSARWRQGYATEAARAVRAWAFEHTPFRRVYSYMRKANVASSATARASGMRLVDEYIDDEGMLTVVYAIDRAEAD